MAKQDENSARRLFEKLGPTGASKYAFTGMMKPADDDQSIMVAPPGDCSNWVQIPARHVQDVEPVQSFHCGDHTHPLVHIFMNEPESSEAKAFAALAQLHQRSFRAAAASIRSRVAMPVIATSIAPHPLTTQHAMMVAPASQAIPGPTPCHYDWTLGQWVCP
jgi:hypothetical protein